MFKSWAGVHGFGGVCLKRNMVRKYLCLIGIIVHKHLSEC